MIMLVVAALLAGPAASGQSVPPIVPPEACPAPASLPPNRITYLYDALGRLNRVCYPNGRVVTYAYDQAGNRLQVTTGG